jgi:hypothetical protein
MVMFVAFFKRFFSTPREPEMKSIEHRGGVVTFRIPAHWREEYSDIEGGIFYGDHSHSGTLRLSIITVAKPIQAKPASALDVLETIVMGLKNDGVVGTTEVLKDGNALFKYEEATSERGRRLTIFYWIVVNPVQPHHARVATFSFTILASQRDKSQVQRDLEMLGAEIEAASFSPKLGLVAE